MARFPGRNGYKEALSNARANANAFGVPYAVFTDTSGVWNSERWRESHAASSWSGVGPATKIEPSQAKGKA